MLKLMKYDIIRSRVWYAITAGTVFLIELAFLLGYWMHNGKLFNIGLVLFIMAGAFGLLALLIYSVQLYTAELNKKSGYMTFLTPRSTYEIIGSKLLVSLLALVVGFVAYFGFLLLNAHLIAGLDGNFLGEVINMIQPKDVPQLILLAFNILFQWFVTIITIYFSVTLSATLLGNVKIRGLISALIFLGINIVVSMISSTLAMDKALSLELAMTAADNVTLSLFLENASEMILISLGVNVALAAGFYFATAALAEKKLSL